MKVNKYNIRDGEVLPIIGGPLDGQTRAVDVAQRWFAWEHYWYTLDEKCRRFVYVGWCARD